jgi:phosphonopyruvate decarboxylase
MITADEFLRPAARAGFDFYTGVPCSFLTPLINRVIGDPSLAYVGAASEGEAVAIAAGAWLAGRRTVVMCQNSGLGNAVNPLTSLNAPFRIPTLLVVTWRGGPGVKDEPQHVLMGQITPEILGVIRIPHRPFPDHESGVRLRIDEACAQMQRTGLPFALVMHKGTVAEEALRAGADEALRAGAEEALRAGAEEALRAGAEEALPAGADEALPAGGAPRAPPAGRRQDHLGGGPQPKRLAALERLLAWLDEDTAVIATTGKAGRELFTLADRPQHLYQVGSMGCASGMGLGVALNTPRPVVVVDGDGAALMKLGTLATIGAYAPPNLVHVLLDNGMHDSTGGQPTVSMGVDFPGVALACGYRNAHACDDLDGFELALAAARGGPGPTMVHLRISPGSLERLGRPSIAPHEVARRFRDFLGSPRRG